MIELDASHMYASSDFIQIEPKSFDICTIALDAIELALTSDLFCYTRI